jgi:hypothetical protein
MINSKVLRFGVHMIFVMTFVQQKQPLIVFKIMSLAVYFKKEAEVGMQAGLHVLESEGCRYIPLDEN